MIYETFAILDTAIGAFNTPIFVRSRGEAIRSFQDAANDEKSNLFRHSRDYILYRLGTYDDSTGLFLVKEPERILSAADALLKSVNIE